MRGLLVDPSSSGPSLDELNSSGWVSLTKGKKRWALALPVQRQCSPLWRSYTWYNMLNTRSFINISALCQLNWVFFVLFLDMLCVHCQSGYYILIFLPNNLLPAVFYGLTWFYYSLPTKPLIFISLINDGTWSCQTTPPNLCQWPCFYRRISGHLCIDSFQWFAHASLVLQFVVQRICLHAEPTWGSHDSPLFGEYQWSLACWKAAPTRSWWMREFKHSFTPEAGQPKHGDHLPLTKIEVCERKMVFLAVRISMPYCI